MPARTERKLFNLKDLYRKDSKILSDQWGQHSRLRLNPQYDQLSVRSHAGKFIGRTSKLALSVHKINQHPVKNISAAQLWR